MAINTKKQDIIAPEVPEFDVNNLNNQQKTNLVTGFFNQEFGTDTQRKNAAIQEYRDTGTFSEGLNTKFQDFAKTNQGLVGGELSAPEITPVEVSAPEKITTTTEGVTPTQPEGTTGITEVDTELDKIRKEKEKSIQDTYDSYNIAKGQFEKEKGNYKNFDDINTKFEGVLSDLRNIQIDRDLTDADYIEIAGKYGLTSDQVKNPTSIFNNLEYTDEGKKEAGITDAESNIADLTTSFEQNKADLTTSLNNTRESVGQNINDTVNSLNDNIRLLEATGTWSGVSRGTGYTTAMNNIKDNADKTISRLEQAMQKTTDQYTTNIYRLTQDYNNSISTAKDDLDSSIKDLKFNMGIQLNGLESKYGIGSTELKDALDAINEEFGTKSLDAYNNYLQTMQNIQTITDNSITQQERINDLIDTKTNQRYNALLENNGLLLQNSSLTGLSQEVQNGTLNIERYNDLKNIMTTSITSSLSNYGTVTPADLTTIDSLLSKGMTPIQVVAQMQTLDRFKPTIEEDVLTASQQATLGAKTITTDTGTYQYNVNTGKYDIPVGTKAITGVMIGGDADTDLTDLRKRDNTGQIAFTGNVGNDLNNPGNLTKGGIADDLAIGYTTVTGLDGVTRNFLVFPDLQTGYDAVGQDLQAKIDGRSTRVDPTDSLSTLLDVWVGGEGASKDYKDKVSEISGYDLNSPISGMDAQIILSGIKEAEGATTKVGNDYSGLMQETIGLTQFQEQNKATVLEQVRTGQYTPSEISGFRKTALDEGWAEELTSALSGTVSGDIADSEDALRKEFNSKSSVSDYVLAKKTFEELQSMLASETGSGDMAAVFTFMKALDPNSVVRETEFEAAASTSGILDKAESLSLWRKAESGELLTPKQRQQFADVIEQVLSVRKKNYDNTVTQYSKLAEDRGLNKNNIILDLNTQENTILKDINPDVNTKTDTGVNIQENNEFNNIWNDLYPNP